MLRLFICQLKELRARRINADLCMVFKIIKNMINLKSSNYFTITKRSSRKPYFILNKKYNCKNKQNFFIRMIMQWNNLPAEITKLSNPKKFRENLNILV